MRTKRASYIVVLFLIISTFGFTIIILPESVSATTRYVGGGGPGNFTKIQDAIDAAIPGDTIFVYSGHYFGAFYVNKTLTFIGEDRNTTWVYSPGDGNAINIVADWVNVSGFTARSSGAFGEPGIMLWDVSNCNISNNNALGNGRGITLTSSNNNIIRSNNVSLNGPAGLTLSYSSYNLISNNTFSSNWGPDIVLNSSSYNTFFDNTMEDRGVFIEGYLLEHWNSHIIDTSNTLAGIPVYYWKNITGGTYPADATQVILANCTDVTVENYNIENRSVGIELGFSEKNRIVNNILVSNRESGLYLQYSNDNIIVNNSASGNKSVWNVRRGIAILHSNGNLITNNSFRRFYYEAAFFERSNQNTFANNTLSNTAYQGVWVYKSHENNITDNVISMSEGSQGVLLSYSNKNDISDNTVLSNDEAGIYVYTSRMNTITNNNVHNNGGAGIYLRLSDDNAIAYNNASNNSEAISLSESDLNIVANNTASGNNVGIDVYMSKRNTISNNTASNNSIGVHVSWSEWINLIENNILNNTRGISIGGNINGTVAQNTILSNLHGIYLGGSSYVFISDNTLIGNRYGISLWNLNSNNTILSNNISSSTAEGISLDTSHYNSIASNRISSTNGDGIYLSYSDNNMIMHNLISNSVWNGVHMLFSDNNMVFNNTVSLNGDYGFDLTASFYNRVYHNNILNNVGQAYDDSFFNEWDNGYPAGGNYWSDYNGSDVLSGPLQNNLGSDGIGDTPYDIPGGIDKDRYPLMSPSGPVFPRPPLFLTSRLSGNNHENVTLIWPPSSDDGAGFKTVVRYDIYRNSTYEPSGQGYTFLASVLNGTYQFVDSFVGEGDPNNYFYRVCAVDFNSNSTCAKYQAGKFTRPLSQGPNLVSIPLGQMNDSIETVLQTVSYDKAWTYDPINQEWSTFMKSKPYTGALEHIFTTMGVWVNVAADSNFTIAGVVLDPTTIDLKAGWNLVGFPSFNGTYTVGDLKASIPVMRVEGLDPTTPPYFLKPLQDSVILQAGHGYWIQVSTDAIWTFP